MPGATNAQEQGEAAHSFEMVGREWYASPPPARAKNHLWRALFWMKYRVSVLITSNISLRTPCMTRMAVRITGLPIYPNDER
jgi:hypothetical protein